MIHQNTNFNSYIEFEKYMTEYIQKVISQSTAFSEGSELPSELLYVHGTESKEVYLWNAYLKTGNGIGSCC